MELIRHKRKDDGLDEGLIDHLEQAIRPSTARNYNNIWSKYESWCDNESVDPTAYDIKQILKFLQAHHHLAPSTLNIYRSAIGSVINKLHPTRKPIREDPDVVVFFRSKRQKTTTIPSLQQLETWDTDILTRDTIIRYDEAKQPQGLILHIRHPKESQQKTTQLGVLQHDPELCLVRCVHIFLQATDQFRT
ncbi:hypothetical protein, partial, partial [Parasitella parasitica]